MKAIQLTNGGYSKVDDEDYPLLSRHNWHKADNLHGTMYAYTTIGKRRVGMHQLVLGGVGGMIPHHIDHDGLNNQKNNLCHCSHADNNRHRRIGKSNKSGFKGVYQHSKWWKAQIENNHRKYFLGRFKDPRDAARAYDLKAVELFGQYALTNKMMGLLQ